MTPLRTGFLGELVKCSAVISSKITPQSSSVRGYSYDKKSGNLLVTFKGGGTYRYKGVTPAVARAMGRNKSVGKTVHRRVKKGGFEYEKVGSYSEGGTFTHDGEKYDLRKTLKLSNKKRPVNMPVAKLDWVLSHDQPDPSRVKAADLSAPVIVAPDSRGKPTVVDGLHRLAKAKALGMKMLPAVQLSQQELVKVGAKAYTCKFCKEPATKGVIWAEGRGIVPCCEKHLGKGKAAITSHDEIDTVRDLKKTSSPKTPTGQERFYTNTPKNKRTAVIIMGNPKYIANDSRADDFYVNLAKFVESKGYDVSFDPGNPHTSPKKADLWIGHSRGVDRLQYAPKGTMTIAMGSPDKTSIRHPLDNPRVGKTPTKHHYMLTAPMKNELRSHMAKTANGDMLAYYQAHPEKAKAALERRVSTLKKKRAKGGYLSDKDRKLLSKHAEEPVMMEVEPHEPPPSETPISEAIFQNLTAQAKTLNEKTASQIELVMDRMVQQRRQIGKMAGAAKKQVTWNGLTMKLEYLKGDERSGVGAGGKKWSRVMRDSYGYIPGTYGQGADGEAIDVYLAPDPVEGPVFKIRQNTKEGKYDEDKFMVGYGTSELAKKAFSRNMPKWAMGTMTSMTMQSFLTVVGQDRSRK